jgi:lipopolysaccharide biosynthesis glycosyltransferase
MEEINIVTSSDSGYVKHIFTQLKNYSLNLLPKYEVHLWLLHYRIGKEDIDELTAYSDFLGIKFHEVYAYDHEDYEILRKGGRNFYPVEGYLYLLAHKYLPKNVKRAICLDAADIILDGDIGEFYFAPFDGNFLIVTKGVSRQELYNFDDLKNPEAAAEIVCEYFNAGSLMLNLQLMRIWNIDMSFYVNIVDHLFENGFACTTKGYPEPVYYMDDQGLIAAAFLGHVKFWDYEAFGFEPLHMPYNFRPPVLENNRERIMIPLDSDWMFPYVPRIIHFWILKPWNTDKEKYDTLLPFSKKYLDMFWEAEREAKAWLEDYRASR